MERGNGVGGGHILYNGKHGEGGLRGFGGEHTGLDFSSNMLSLECL